MTVRITVNRICDRCLRPFDGSQHEGIDDLSEFEKQDQYILTRTDRKSGEVTTLFTYKDLCDTCDGVVTKALAKLRLSRVESDRASFNLPTEESSQKEAPTVEETPVETAPTPDPKPKESSSRKAVAQEALNKISEELDAKHAAEDAAQKAAETPADEEELPF